MDRGLPLSLSALKTLRYMQTRPWDAITVLNISGALHLELERLLLAYVTHILEQRLQSVDFLKRLRRENIQPDSSSASSQEMS